MRKGAVGFAYCITVYLCSGVSSYVYAMDGSKTCNCDIVESELWVRSVP